MTAEIFNLRDYQSKKAIERATAEIDAEAKRLLAERGAAFHYQPKQPAIYTETVGYTMGNGIDGMYVSPEKDPA